MRRNSMLHNSMKLLGAGSLLFAALLAGQTAFAQSIVGSKHDLSTGGTTSNKATSATQVCVFCHTPHGADAAAPLWNRNVPNTGSYQFYNSASLDSPVGTAASIGLQSTMCLSCHDGVTALNNLINSPGSGTGTPPTMGGDGTLTGLFANLSTDLRNDHPIGILYCGGAGGTTAVPNGCVDKDFKLTSLIKNSGAAQTIFAAGTSTDFWWLDTTGGTAGTRDKTDLPLYVNATNLVPTVQCASCHEPHTNNASTGVVAFLRTSNAASAICTTCHAK